MPKKQSGNKRHKQRQDEQNETWLKGRRSQISNILTNLSLMGQIEVRLNNTERQGNSLKEEVMEIINGKWFFERYN